MDTTELDLPGFRFHPTEEELLEFYLKKMVLGKKLRFDIIGFLNIYQHDPWDLPGLAKIGEREWYFFVRRDRKHGNGGRPNRTTQHGFWKATGSDRPIRRLSDPKRILGLRKTLVFYKGRAPRGSKTDWVMNEYRMPQTSSSPEEDIVLCKIYRKATSLKVLEQRAAMEEETNIFHMASSFPMTTLDGVQQETYLEPISMPTYEIFPKTEHEEEEEEVEKRKDDVAMQKGSACSSSSNLPHLQVPQFNLDWMQDPFLTQLRSPWMDNWTPYTNLLNI